MVGVMTDHGAQFNCTVRDMVRRRNDWLAAQRAARPAGATLCVHDLPSGGDLDTVTIRAEAHVLGPDGCDATVRRTQYGPVTAEIQAQAARERKTE